MRQAIDNRQLITLDGSGVLFRGTYHRPSRQLSGVDRMPGERDRVGVLFLNSLSIPRAGTGDSAVYWADAFAECGYPAFRFDLPGLGDSLGDIPAQLLDFMNAGSYGDVAAAKVKELVQRFSLSGVVIVGHCAGAITAIHAAQSPECKGLILMDPYFHLTQAIRPKARQHLSEWARRSRLGGLVSNAYDALRDLHLLLHRNRPPRNANFPLLARWRQVASSGLPILIFKAPGLKTFGTKPRTGDFDYLKHVMKAAGRESRVVVQYIEETDHSFANRLGRAALRRHAEDWLTDHFPQGERDQDRVLALHDGGDGEHSERWSSV